LGGEGSRPNRREERWGEKVGVSKKGGKGDKSKSKNSDKLERAEIKK